MPTIEEHDGLVDVKTNLGHVSAYAIAKAHGFEGTEAEWEAMIANAGTYGQQAMASQAAAETARVAAETAQAAAEAAQAAAEDARDRTGEELANKVDVVAGKGLSSNDYTDAEKEKLAAIEEGANKNVTVDWNATYGDAFIRNKPRNLVQDENYVHTDNNLTDALLEKLENIEAGGQVNVQGDWTETDTESDAFIRNKPENLVQDANYVHTDENFTSAQRQKLQNIEAGAEVNVQADWTAVSGDAAILNKPEHLVQDADYVHTDSNYTTAEKTKLAGVEAGAEVNVQADWAETDSTSDAFIKNKPLTDVDNALSDTSTDPVQNKIIKAALDEKVDKIAGMQLSQNNFTNGEKEKLASIETGATNVTVDSAISQNSDNPVSSKAIYTELSKKVNSSGSKQLSDENFTSEEKTKLAGIQNGATNVSVDAEITQNSNNPVTSAAIYAELAKKVDADGGAGLSDNNFTDAYKEKLDGIASEATKTIVDATITENSTNPVTSAAVFAALATKVDADGGAGLSDNNFTDAYKTKLEGIEAGANKITVDSATSTTSTNPVQNKVITGAVNTENTRATTAENDIKNNLIAVSDTQPTAATTKLWVNTNSDEDTVMIPTLEDVAASWFVDSDYKAKMKKYFELSGCNAMQDLTSICDKWYRATRTGWTGGVRFAVPASGAAANSDGTKTGDNAGLTCVPSTTEQANTDDYKNLPLFACVDCNVYLDDTGKPHITGIDGVGGVFERNNPEKIVGVLQMAGWVRFVNNGETYGWDYTDEENASGFHPLSEAVELADNSVRSWVVHGKYNFGENWTCCSGVKTKVWNVSHNTQLSGVRTQWGTRYCGATSADDAWLKLMLYLKYGQLDSDRILHGCNNYNYEYQPALAETGVERILLTTAQAANLIVGSTIVLAASKRAQSNVLDRVRITEIRTVEVDGASYGAVYVDNGGTTFDTTTEMWLSTMQWYTGSTDDVLGNDGGINPASDKYPVKLQGIEYMVGCYEAMGDTMLIYGANNGVNCCTPWVCRDATKLSTSKTSDYVSCGLGIPTPASAAWQYPKQMHGDNDLPELIFPVDNGGSTSGGPRDGFYTLANTSGTYEWLRLGYLNRGVGAAGLSCGDGYYGLPTATWSFGGRLSVTGNRGEFQAA